MSRRGGVLLAGVLLGLMACQPSPQVRLDRGREASFRKDPKRALKEYRLALDALEKDDAPSAQVLKAQVLKAVGDTYYLELRDIRQAVSIYKELIAQCPEAPETLDAHVTLAEILHAYYHDDREAIRELAAALARNPPQSAELNYQVAKLYFELQDYPQCELEAQKLVKRFETSPFVDDALFLQAQALGMREGMHKDAARVYRDLVERFPKSELAPHALFELGKLKAEQGENDAAIKLWVEALKTHPDPKLVQATIARIRRRITETTPQSMGKQAAFAKEVKIKPSNKKTSVEAAGGSAEEARHDNGD